MCACVRTVDEGELACWRNSHHYLDHHQMSSSSSSECINRFLSHWLKNKPAGSSRPCSWISSSRYQRNLKQRLTLVPLSLPFLVPSYPCPSPFSALLIDQGSTDEQLQEMTSPEKYEKYRVSPFESLCLFTHQGPPPPQNFPSVLFFPYRHPDLPSSS